VILRALRRITANADLKRIIGAAKDIAAIHRNPLRLARTMGSLFLPFDSPRCGLAQDKTSHREILEAEGVELLPPVDAA
jgi:hypothetical protein